MVTAAPTRVQWKDVVMLACAIVGPAAVVGGALRSDGGRDKQIDDNTRRISQLEADRPNNEAGEKQILDRLARIETKLELLVPLKAAQR